MQVRPRGAPCSSAQSNFLAPFHEFSLFHFELRKMEVEREQALAMVEHHTISFVVEKTRQQHRTLIHGRDGSARGDPEIQAPVRSLRFAIEDALRTEDVRNLGMSRR